MKHIRFLPLFLAFCVMLAACGKPADKPSESTASDQSETEAQTAEPTLPPEGGYSMQELCFSRDGKKIYGELYLPEGNGPFPGVVIGHGLESSVEDTRVYAIALARYGIAAYAFDFIGGGSAVRSDGDIMEMSVLTEAKDMKVVLDGIRALDAVDENNVFLMGLSQGGFVATYVASQRPKDVKGLIGFYPAYGLQDDVKERTANGNHITEETCVVNDVDVGEIYVTDILSFSFFGEMKNYTGSVLIIHGTEDEVTPLEYSERAVRTLSDVELITIEGAEHGFYDEDQRFAAETAALFIWKVIGR